MLTADKSKRFELLFSLYNRHYLIGRRFRSFAISGEVDPCTGESPVLYIMNHSSWWDGLLVYMALSSRSRREHYMMMEERQLRKYRFFSKIGAYSIDRERPADIRRSMRYTADLLNQGAGVWIFPQGEIRHLEQRPLGFKPGIGLLLRQASQASVVPVTLYHGMAGHAKPEATLRFGFPLRLPWQNLTAGRIAEILEENLTEQLNEHKRQVLQSPFMLPGGFEPLMKPSRSTNEWLDAVKGFGLRRRL